MTFPSTTGSHRLYKDPLLDIRKSKIYRSFIEKEINYKFAPASCARARAPIEAFRRQPIVTLTDDKPPHPA